MFSWVGALFPSEKKKNEIQLNQMDKKIFIIFFILFPLPFFFVPISVTAPISTPVPLFPIVILLSGFTRFLRTAKFEVTPPNDEGEETKFKTFEN